MFVRERLAVLALAGVGHVTSIVMAASIRKVRLLLHPPRSFPTPGTGAWRACREVGGGRAKGSGLHHTPLMSPNINYLH